MKSRTLTLITAITLFAALAIPVPLAAQNRHSNQHHHYKLIDLGTSGGPSSYLSIDNGVNHAPNQVLNSRGIAVGWADTSTPDPYAPNCFNFDCFTSYAFQWQKGTRIDLGALPGGQNSSASWISDSGLIAGQSQNGVVDPLVPGFPEIRATMWTKDGQIINLGTLGGNESSAFSVNNRGQVVGVAVNTIPDPFSFLATQLRAFLWHDGAMKDLGTLGTGNNAWALFVNERGQVAGFSDTSPNPGPLGVPPVDPFLWERGTMLDLGTLGGTSGSPLGLNNRGQVVGTSDLGGDLATHPFLWTKPGPMQDLGTFGGDNGFAEHINDAGEIAGTADFAGHQIHHAALWRSGVMTDLGTLEGDPCSEAHSINAKAQVVGGSSDCNTFLHAFLWENGGPAIDLNTLVAPGAGLTMTIAGYINDRGEIAGAGFPTGCTAQDGDLCSHAYVLIPCDENHPGVEDCDYSMVDEAAATREKPAPAMQTPAGAIQSNSVRQMLRQRLGLRYHIPGPTSGARVISGPNVTLSPTSLTFSTQAIGTTSAAKTVTLKNTGTTTLTITAIAITGTNAGDFAQTHTCGSSLAAGASCKIRVKFEPTMSGTRTAALSIADNAAGSPQTVALSGTGVGTCYVYRCFGPGPLHCCPAPRPHHSFCSNPTGWGICIED